MTTYERDSGFDEQVSLYTYFNETDGLSDSKIDSKLHYEFMRLREDTEEDYRLLVTDATVGFIFKKKLVQYALFAPPGPIAVGRRAWTLALTTTSLPATLSTMKAIRFAHARGTSYRPSSIVQEVQQLRTETRQLKAVNAQLRYKVEHQPQEHGEGQYLDILQRLVALHQSEGATANRTSVTAVKIFAATMRFNLSGGQIPLLTTKKLHLKSIVHELIWFLRGQTNIAYLTDHGVRIWNEWATDEDGKDRKRMALPKGSVGPLYGEQWRRFPAGEFFYNLTDDELRTYVLNMATDQYDDMVHALEPLKIDVRHPGNPYNVSPAALNADGYASLIDLRQYLTKLGIDQISQAIFLLKVRPNSRRNLVTSWNPQVVPSDDLTPQENVVRRRAALAACHAMFQFVTKPISFATRADMVKKYFAVTALDPAMQHPLVTEANINNYRTLEGNTFPTHRLSCVLLQRSCDMVLGVPFNIASYALLIHMVAKQVNMVPDEFFWVGSDTHLYSNHLEAAEEQLTREPKGFPILELKEGVKSIFDYEMSDLKVVGYVPHDSIKAKVAV